MDHIKRYFSVTFRPELVSDNVNKTMVLNRFLSNPLMVLLYVTGLDILIVLAVSFCINVISILPLILRDWMHMGNYINLSLLMPKIDSREKFIAYIFLFIVLIVIDIRQAYLMRVSYAEEDINKGNSGTRRWTTLKEIMRQYKEIELLPSTSKTVKVEDVSEQIPDKLPEEGGSYVDRIICDDNGEVVEEVIKTPNWYKGKGGLPVTRWRDKLYIDSQLTNNLFIGTTRSGKGEIFVFTLIDILSRAYKKADRPSMIIFDPKLELYKSSKHTLEKRGYITRLVNLDDPKRSAGYNPLAIITEYYAEGKHDEAQLLAKSFSFSIFNSSKDMQEPIWKNTATDLFTALIMAVVSDCISMDEELNSKRREQLREMKENFESIDDIEEARERFYQIEEAAKTDGKDLITECENYGINYAPPEYEFEKIYPNRKNINCFSVIHFFRELCDVNSESAGQDPRAGEKKAETALDDYFNSRPQLDYARSLYASIKTAGDRTKGSIYVNMQSALTIFSMDSIARMTAENDIDFREIGFGDDPVAIFVGIPTEDKSNHFLALNFITQIFQYLFKLAKADKGKLRRNVRFILDEFGNMPILDNFGGMVTNCLGVGFSFDVFIQSYDQLKTNYEMEVDTIKDNFANQIYIMAIGQETPSEFSDQLGNKTIVDVQRTGTRLGKNKTFMESTKEKPLLFAADLQDLKEGECAIIRGSKRTDRAGAAIRSYPILCEYMAKPFFWWYFIAAWRNAKSRKENGPMWDKDEDRPLTWAEEYRYHLSQIKRRLGTAFLYRWQYAISDFPNPTDIKLSDICIESRSAINYTQRVYDTDMVIQNLGLVSSPSSPVSVSRKARTLKDLRDYYAFDNKLSEKVENYKDEFGLYPDTDIQSAMSTLKVIQKRYALAESFISTLETMIMQG